MHTKCFDFLCRFLELITEFHNLYLFSNVIEMRVVWTKLRRSEQKTKDKTMKIDLMAYIINQNDPSRL